MSPETLLQEPPPAVALGPEADPLGAQTEDARGSRQPLGLYIHIPFCTQRCPYCDFNTYAGLDHLFEPYVDALVAELRGWAQALGHPPVDTVFLGGGTPTVLPIRLLARILDSVAQAYRLEPGCEITSEVNPGTVDRPRFAALRSLGVNRLSMGAQSFHPHELRFLGRLHGPEDVVRAFRAARSAGFENINLDFIFGLPEQDPGDWASTLDQALALAPEHLSLYSLMVEPNTPLFHWVQRGRVSPPDDDRAAHLYEMALDRLERAGYVQYEISNWARTRGAEGGPTVQPTYACRHNLHYWRNEEYLGVGAGACGHLRREAPPLAWRPDTFHGIRWENHRPVAGYIHRIQDRGHAVNTQDPISPATAMAESMMLGLRLVREGVSRERFARCHGQDLLQVYGASIAELERAGLVEWTDGCLRLTRRGLLLGNRVAMAFLPG